MFNHVVYVLVFNVTRVENEKRIKTLHEVRIVCLVDHAFNFTNSKQRSCKGKKIYMLENNMGQTGVAGMKNSRDAKARGRLCLPFSAGQSRPILGSADVSRRQPSGQFARTGPKALAGCQEGASCPSRFSRDTNDTKMIYL